MKLSVSTLAFQHLTRPYDAIEKLVDAGFERVEVVLEPNLFITGFFNDAVRDLLELAESTGVEYTVHAPFSYEFFTHSDEMFRRDLMMMLMEASEFAESINSKFMVVHAGRASSIDKFLAMKKGIDWRDAAIRSFADTLTHMPDNGVKLCVENLAHAIIESPEHVLKLKELAPNVGFCWDVAHSHVQGNTDAFMNSELKPDYFHITDNDSVTDKHWALGRGNLPIRGVKEFLKSISFSGPVVLENKSIEEALSSKEYWESIK